MTEKQIENQIKSYIKSLGWICEKANAGKIPFTRKNGKRGIFKGITAGFPDLIFILPKGKIIFCEVKTPKGKLTFLQEKYQERLIELGHIVLVCKSIDEVERDLRELGFIG